LIGAVNSVIAFGYYGTVMREMWMKPAPDGDTTRVGIPGSLALALAITSVATLVLGILPGVATHFGDIARITGAFGG
jgi:NADH:ubiquinone oxidoreductase subunit 2 (subunit N)